ncbi:unnamed protein product [Ectocarpus sp. CCAP 1310/34]|nr:unnamed protein product [Ectocarpus sp. CCAP 1310/34]
MLSALRCFSTGSSIRARGMNIDGNAIVSGIRLFSGTTTTRGGRGRAGGTRPAFELLDEDIEERFGSGPGGQKINKVRNCVQLTHLPSGVSVSCQDSRELHANRHIARKRLKEKVEFQLMGADSKVGRRINNIRNKKARSQRKSRLKHQAAAAAATSAKQPEPVLSNDEVEKMMMAGGGGTGHAVDSASEVDEEESDWEDSGSNEAGR